ncbi:ribonuclease H2, subunit C [Neurospora tetraspora]|uniref:Ribonuclease H2, subunit C n=1 Tax=Neurospora tetraspora TaxID=94610 RepID=A0AAE0J7S1_9PEZI|nr:ribonuclease H2, subunit C [Neurospora tetraspora]
MTQQPILAFTPSTSTSSTSSSTTSTPIPKTTPNLLPCRIHHDGPVEPTDSFWNPREEDGLKVSYFRGRKLHGKTLPLPEGYKGVVASKAPKQEGEEEKKKEARLPHEMSFVMDNDNEPEVVDLEAEESSRQEPEVGGWMEIQAEFEEVVVWGHESLADAGGDAYVRGVEEWIGFANKMHSF